MRFALPFSSPRYRLLRCLMACATASLLSACPSLPPATPGNKPPDLSKPAFIRPASGATLVRFDGIRNKGIDIAGQAGDPVLAAADGRVVYIGDELRGYGNMLIIQHGKTFITAYAHNQVILVHENDFVRQGQKIALMGNTGTDQVKLHFELRKQGEAVDPEPYLQGKLR